MCHNLLETQQQNIMRIIQLVTKPYLTFAFVLTVCTFRIGVKEQQDANSNAKEKN